MAIEIKAPHSYPNNPYYLKVFLAGSIEEGRAIPWQAEVVHSLSYFDNVLLLNPRRDDWDASWVQSIDNPQFAEQVNWELDGLDAANFIFLYFDPATKSPISLLELGLHIGQRNMIVVCPDGFWRKGNVDIVCGRAGLPVFTTIEQGLNYLKRNLFR